MAFHARAKKLKRHRKGLRHIENRLALTSKYDHLFTQVSDFIIFYFYFFYFLETILMTDIICMRDNVNLIKMKMLLTRHLK